MQVPFDLATGEVSRDEALDTLAVLAAQRPSAGLKPDPVAPVLAVAQEALQALMDALPGEDTVALRVQGVVGKGGVRHVSVTLFTLGEE